MLANGRPAPDSGVGSEEHAWFLLSCGKCKTKIQLRTACKYLEAAFRCKVCGDSSSSNGEGSSRQRRLSAPQLAAVRMLQQLPGAGPVSVEQYRVLPMQKPIDAVLDEYNIMVEVDGSQHAESSTGFGQAAGAQHKQDRQVDRAVLAMGGRLVRLHWQDEASWMRHVQAAIQRVQQQPNSSFVYYSASFPQSSRVPQPPPSSQPTQPGWQCS